MLGVKRLVAISLAGGFLLVASNGGRADQAVVDISGTWVLNEDLSDDPQEVIQSKMEEMRARQGGQGGGMGRPRGGMGGYGGGAPSGNREEMRKRLEEMDPPKKIVITQNDDEITIIPEGRDTITVVPDGKERKEKTPLGEVGVTAEWDDFALEVRTKGVEGGELTRRFRINDNGRLEVVTDITPPRGGEKIEIVMRYDEANAK